MRLEAKSILKKLGKLEQALVKKVESGTLLNEARKFADAKSKLVKQRLKSSKDAKKLAAFVQKRKKDVEKLAANLPRETQMIRAYVKTQSKELEKLANDLLKQAKEGKLNATSFKAAIRAATTKKAAPKKRAAPKKKAKRSK